MRHLMTVFRFSHEQGELAKLPAWRKLREPTRCPLAFTQEEFVRLLSAAKVEAGKVAGVPACFWWDSLLRSIWFSGFRIGAVLSVPTRDVLISRGGFYARAERQKHNQDQFFKVDAATVESWQRIFRADRELFWDVDVCRHTIYRRFAKLIKLAGVDGPTRKRFHRIRCSTASYLKRNGGNPTEQLGHSSPSVTRPYYDPRIVGESSILQFMPALS
jgi:integrase